MVKTSAGSSAGETIRWCVIDKPQIHSQINRCTDYQILLVLRVVSQRFNPLDKIKIFNDNNKIIPQSIINNTFLNAISRKDSSRQRHRITYTCEQPIIVSVDGFGTYIEFNPTSLLRGHNLVQINRSEILTAIHMVEDLLSITIADWKLTGLDFNQNIETLYAPSGYMPIFRKMAAYNKQVSADGNSITYFNKSRCLRLYDKIIQATAADLQFDPEEFPQNLLRVELGISARLQKLKAFGEVTNVSQLLDLDTYILVVDEWERMYGKIAKQSIQRFRHLVRPLDMDLKKFSVVEFINGNGMQAILDALDSDVKQGRLHYQTAYARKEQYRLLWESYLLGHHNQHDLLLELDQKVRTAAERSRQVA